MSVPITISRWAYHDAPLSEEVLFTAAESGDRSGYVLTWPDGTTRYVTRSQWENACPVKAGIALTYGRASARARFEFGWLVEVSTPDDIANAFESIVVRGAQVNTPQSERWWKLGFYGSPPC